jgi:hypothetical protein
VNKALFDEKWDLFRELVTPRWSLMAEYDLAKVDKDESKFIRFLTMLQVKYGYTRPQAKEETDKLWAEYEAKQVS